jgi:hypothetical protein
MSFTKCAGPVVTANDGEAQRDHQLGSEKISLTNTPAATKPQAPPLLAHTAGESDLAYFTARPGISTRTRLPFPNEFPPGVLEPSRVAFVHVLLVTRDPKTNAPATRARAIFYADNRGGCA